MGLGFASNQKRPPLVAVAHAVRALARLSLISHAG